jgi:hypothetical protein
MLLHARNQKPRSRRMRRQRMADSCISGVTPGMKYEITSESGYVRVEVFERQSNREAEEFLRDIVAANRKFDHHRILINFHVRDASPMPVVAYYELVKLVEKNSGSGGRIALVGDTGDVRQLNEFAQATAQIQGLRIRAFTDGSTARIWVLRDD